METLQDAYNAQEYAALVKELAAAVFSFNTSVSLSRSFCDSGSFVEDIFTGIAVGSWEKQQEQTVTICFIASLLLFVSAGPGTYWALGFFFWVFDYY